MLASIPPPPITSLHLGPVRVTVFGLVVAVAVLVGVSRHPPPVRTRGRRSGAGGPGARSPRIVVGFVGARLAYVATNTGRFQGRWLEVFAVWQGGLALFGGLTFGTLTAIWLVRRFQGDLGAFAGAAAIGVPLAQAIGRPADYFSQELYGTPSTLPWAVQVPERFRPAAYADAATFHPAFFYEALWSLATVGVLLWLERRGVLRRGQLFLGYLVAYGARPVRAGAAADRHDLPPAGHLPQRLGRRRPGARRHRRTRPPAPTSGPRSRPGRVARCARRPLIPALPITDLEPEMSTPTTATVQVTYVTAPGVPLLRPRPHGAGRDRRAGPAGGA